MSVKRLALINLFLKSVFIEYPKESRQFGSHTSVIAPSCASQRARLVSTNLKDELQPYKICALAVLTTEWKPPSPSHLGKRRSPSQTCWGWYENLQNLLNLRSVVHKYQHSATADVERERLATFDNLRGAIDLRRHLKWNRPKQGHSLM